MKIVHVTMSSGNQMAYLNRWEVATTDTKGYLGTGWAFGTNVAKALRFTVEHGVGIASFLTKNLQSPGIVYGICDAGELFPEEEN